VSRRAWWWLLQVGLFAGVSVLVARQLVRHWAEFPAGIHLSVHPPWLLASTALVGITYLVQIESWRGLLAGWGQRLSYRDAARIWFLANLGRYVPGKVWSVAGMVVLAQRVGVAPWAATASAVAVQALGIGTAAAVVALAVPGAESTLRLVIAGAAAAATVGVLAWEGFTSRARSLHPRVADLRPLPPLVLGWSGLLTFVSWLSYGAVFWSLGLGLGLPVPSLPAACGVFALGYVAGLLALFAPGGAVIREGVFTALLAPTLGLPGAVALSLASRIQLTLTEAATGLAAMMVMPPPKEKPVDRLDDR
jgi:glycosyltransferase 2 family protein